MPYAVQTYVLSNVGMYVHCIAGRPTLLPRKDQGSTASCMQASGSYLSNCAVAHVQLAVGHLRSYDLSRRQATAPRPPNRKRCGTTSRNAYTTGLLSALVHPKKGHPEGWAGKDERRGIKQLCMSLIRSESWFPPATACQKRGRICMQPKELFVP